MQTLERNRPFSFHPDDDTVVLLDDVEAPERGEARAPGPIGRLVSVNGAEGVIDCVIHPGDEDFSIGHLVTIDRQGARAVGVIRELSSVETRWSQGEPNAVRAVFEMHGEIVDGVSDRPVFRRGVRTYPPLGAPVRRIRADDLRTIYTFRGHKGVEIGRLSQNASVPAEISVDQLIGRHFVVVGTTGVGKTTTTSLLIARSIAARPNLRVLILDPHNEYAEHFPDQACVIDSESLELPIWMFRFDELSDVIFEGRTPHSDEREALYEVIQRAKSMYAAEQESSQAGTPPQRRGRQAITPDTPTPFFVADALAIIDEWTGKLEQRYDRGDLRTLRARVEALSHDPRYRFMFGFEHDVGKIVSKLFRVPTEGLPVTIIKLAGLPNEVTNSVVSVLSRLAFEIAYWCAGAFEIAVICEEAHRYIARGEGSLFEPARRAIRRIAKEGRKYGVTLGVIAPRPSELDPTVLSQCSSIFAMRLANEADKRIISEAAGASAQGMVDLLSSIADREAIALGEAVAMPMRMTLCEWALRSPNRRLTVLEAETIALDMLAAQLKGECRERRSPRHAAA